MTKYHERAIRIGFSDLPLFKTNEDANDFYRTVGYMLTYGMHSIAQQAQEDTSQGATLQIDKDGEMTLVLYGVQDSYEKRDDGSYITLGSKRETVATLVDSLRTDHPMVMGAVKHDGKYGTHT